MLVISSSPSNSWGSGAATAYGLVLCEGGEGGDAGHVAVIWTGSHVAQGGELVLGTILAYVAVQHRGYTVYHSNNDKRL